MYILSIDNSCKCTVKALLERPSLIPAREICRPADHNR
jgi:hypothetical protein